MRVASIWTVEGVAPGNQGQAGALPLACGSPRDIYEQMNWQEEGCLAAGSDVARALKAGVVGNRVRCVNTGAGDGGQAQHF